MRSLVSEKYFEQYLDGLNLGYSAVCYLLWRARHSRCMAHRPRKYHWVARYAHLALPKVFCGSSNFVLAQLDAYIIFLGAFGLFFVPAMYAAARILSGHTD